MGMLHIFSERGDDVRRFDEALKRAKSGLHEACEIWEDMVSQFSEREGSYGERGMRYRDEHDRDARYRDEMSERSRDRRGRWI